ncbi:MAG: F0F1 ATP synthase subunit delta [Chloroflexi bacterium]|nr:F0F1 ATP synthase subunit delta [Chloroflexota bacterium]
MAKAPIAKRYAQALFSLAEAEGKQEAWLESLSDIAEGLSDPSAALFFNEPRIPAARKAEAAAQIAAGSDPLVRNFVGLVVQRRAVGSFRAVVNEYGRLLNESLGRVQASVASAVPLSAEQRTALTASLGAMLDKEVVLYVQDDQDIIGGIVVRVGDQIIDGSVRSRLNGLRQSLERQGLPRRARETEERA